MSDISGATEAAAPSLAANSALVWVVHPVKDDLSPADKWGRVCYVNDRYIYADEYEESEDMGLMVPRSVQSKINDAARRFNFRQDYLMVAGDHVQIVALTAKLAYYYQWFKCLRYDRISNGYLPVTVVPGVAPHR